MSLNLFPRSFLKTAFTSISLSYRCAKEDEILQSLLTTLLSKTEEFVIAFFTVDGQHVKQLLH